MPESSPKGLKTLGKEEITELVRLLALTHYHTMPYKDIAVENIERKEEIACNRQFLLFLQFFLP